jgi:nitrite reductase/ring-hydroxylating ferredoxin subunit
MEIVDAVTPCSGAVAVCAADELWDGEMACFRVGDAAVLLVKRARQFLAYQAHCPHQGVPLAEGELEGDVLTCRAHRWQFDAATGQGVNPRSTRLKRFPVQVVAGRVLVDVGSSALEPLPHPRASPA